LDNRKYLVFSEAAGAGADQRKCNRSVSAIARR
jgi:hypothetical protein